MEQEVSYVNESNLMAPSFSSLPNPGRHDSGLYQWCKSPSLCRSSSSASCCLCVAIYQQSSPIQSTPGVSHLFTASITEVKVQTKISSFPSEGIYGVFLSSFSLRSETNLTYDWIGVVGMKPWRVKATHETLDGSSDAQINGGSNKACGGDEGRCNVGVNDLVVAVCVDGDGDDDDDGYGYATGINSARVFLGLSILGLALLGFF